MFEMAESSGSARRGKYGKWSEIDMDRALSAWRNGDMGLNAASRTYHVPKATLKRHLENRNIYANDVVKYFGHPKVLTEQLEELLVEHVIDLDSMLFGMTPKDLRSMAFQLAERNNLPHNFNKEKQIAGKQWYRDFMKRHPNLALRQPEATSLARASGFNRESVGQFFQLLETIIEKHKFNAENIFNMDESGITSVQRPTRVVSVKGKKQVGAMTSGERGTNTTVVCCFSAEGRYVPPMIIFKRKRMNDLLKNGVPAGSLVVNNESGWMDSEQFNVWLRHFHANVKSTKEKPVLLLLDGHASHTKNLEAIEFARDHGIHILSLPPHTTHKMQPLDRTFFKPLMSNYNQAADKWIRNHPGQAITLYQVGELFGEAYVRSATMANAVSGFSACGIWPCNRDIFTHSDFAVSDRFNENGDMPQDGTREISETTSNPQASLGPPTTVHIAIPSSSESQTPIPSRPSPCMSPTTQTPSCAPPTSQIPSGTLPPGKTTSGMPPPSQIPSSSSVSSVQSGICMEDNGRLMNDGDTNSRRSTRPSIIHTYPDGRCFFRSLTVAMDKKLQEEGRDRFGLLDNPVLRILEQSQADSLRAKVVTYMCSNYAEFEDFDKDELVNADLPQHLQYGSLQERIEAMARPSEMVGELEIVATAKTLRRPIHVMSENGIVRFGDTFVGSEPLTVWFSKLGEDVGHYDFVSSQQVNNGTPELSVTPRVVSPLPKPVRKATSRQSNKCELITSSPYKEQLQKKTCVKRRNKTKCVKNTKKQKHWNEHNSTTRTGGKKVKPSSSDGNWYCFICGEDIAEDMVQCCSCQRWVHTACGNDTSGPQYVCDGCN